MERSREALESFIESLGPSAEYNSGHFEAIISVTAGPFSKRYEERVDYCQVRDPNNGFEPHITIRPYEGCDLRNRMKNPVPLGLCYDGRFACTFHNKGGILEISGTKNGQRFTVLITPR
ncbi:hypothetical protein LDL36_18360 [Komagataeibacter sp. FNDCR1]|nr:hypothetical protein [Komagataeibacter sp. FNDCR1]